MIKSYEPCYRAISLCVQLIVLSLLAGSTSFVTIVGNVIVILSFIIERSIRQPTNYFIASLAVSDLLIGTSQRMTLLSTIYV